MTIEGKVLKNIYVSNTRDKEIEILKSKGIPMVIVGEEVELLHGIKVRDLKFEVSDEGILTEFNNMDNNNEEFSLDETASKTNIMRRK